MILPDGAEFWWCVAVAVLIACLVYILLGGARQWL